MQWLRSFAALALLCGVVMMLLPEGGLRKTAALVIGLMLTLSWLDSLRELPLWPDRLAHPDTLLAETVSAAAGTEAFARQLSSGLTKALGTDVRVELDAAGRVSGILLPEECDEATRRRCLDALGVSEESAAQSAYGR